MTTPDLRPLLKKALLRIEVLEGTAAQREAERTEPIAIVGLACRFPGGGSNPEAFWQALENGVDGVRRIPEERWAHSGIPGQDLEIQWAALLDDPSGFDAACFGISPREAVHLDPQQRLVLEVAWEALERGGQDVTRLIGSRTGVFLGQCSTDYAFLLNDNQSLDQYSSTGTTLSTVSGRVAFTFGFQGPCLTLDTACSSSLVATHLACQSLRQQESDLALAGGVNLVLHPFNTAIGILMKALSPDGRCKTFDARANGFVRGEGCGMLVLKRLSDAKRDGDPIYAVIRGSAINHDGRSTGLTVPNMLAQRAMLRAALENARVQPEDIGYVETHGTGTSLGDPIEFDALRQVVGQPRSDGSKCVLGAVKTNVGHLEAAAGVAGLIKIIGALQNGRIPKNLHFETLNPHLSLTGTSLVIPNEVTPWTANGKPRRAGVSSFGFSGTNAHVIVEEAPDMAHLPKTNSPNACLVSLSARSPEARIAMAKAYAEHLSAERADSLADLAFTAGARRAHHEYRLAVVGSSKRTIASALEAFVSGEMPPEVVVGAARGTPRVVFVFSGQGSQWVGMGRRLAEEEPVFREALVSCAERLLPHTGFSILDELAKPEELSRLAETIVVQPAMFAIGVALAKLFQSWGINPDTVLGHSVGEITAAHIAGILDLDQAARLVALRARIMQKATGKGKMISVSLDEKKATLAIQGFEDRIGIAAINDRNSVVLSGDAETIDRVVERLAAGGVEGRPLRVNYAFHSPQMDSLRDEFVKALGVIASTTGTIPMISTVTGLEVSGEQLDATYWGSNIRQTVRFADAVAAAYAAENRLFVEIGPHPVLSLNVETFLSERAEGGRAIATLRRQKDERQSVLAAVGALHVQGASVDWRKFYPDGGRVVNLPAYPWQRKRFWIESSRSLGQTAGIPTGHPLLGSRLSVAGVEAVFESELGPKLVAWFADHRVFGEIVVPGAALVEIAHTAGAQYLATNHCRIENFVIQSPLRFENDAPRRVQVILSRMDGGNLEIALYSKANPAKPDESWLLHARGTVHSVDRQNPRQLNLAALKTRCVTTMNVAEAHERYANIGLEYGPMFQCLTGLWKGENEALASLSLPDAIRTESAAYGIHPALLDAALQTLAGAMENAEGFVYLPFEFGDFLLSGPALAGVETWVHARVERAAEAGAEVISAALELANVQGDVVATLANVRLKRAHVDALRRASQEQSTTAHLYRLNWQPQENAAASTPHLGSYLLLGGNSERFKGLESRLNAAGAHLVTATLNDWLDAPAELQSPASIVWIGDTSAAREDPHSAADVAQCIAVDALSLVQTLTRKGLSARLVFVTRGAMAVGPGEPGSPSLATLWGFGRTLMQEHPEFECKLVDLDPTDDDIDDSLWKELGSKDGESQIAWRAGKRHVARINVALAGSGMCVPDGPSHTLVIKEKGSLSNLHLVSAPRQTPGAGEIEIEVHASGLNFRDVLNALGMYPGNAGTLGGECAGIITAIGAGVEHFAVGDRVMALAPGAFSAFVTVDARLVAPVPRGLSMAQAATIPVVFLTAYYALYDLANLQRDDRILIHAAAGGVGMAAAQIAKLIGAEILATASPFKWAIVRAMGIPRVENSRNLDFARVFQDARPNVVLNSLAGEFVDASLSLLAPGGRFLEMGKTDIRSADTITQTHPGVMYRAFDLWEAGPDRIRVMLAAIVAGFDAGQLQSLPIRSFALADAENAFRFMAQARHTGKIALVAARKPNELSRSTVLVTGGLGGLGLRVARWLWERHAVGHLLLAGRTAPTGDRLAEIEQLRAQGAHLTIARADICEPNDVQTLLDSIPTDRPLRGIIHAAGLLDDGLIAEQNESRLTRVFGPKVRGAWHLHEKTRAIPLSFFVMFSSVASVFGSAGQSNYGAANAFLDALAHMRQAEGLPAQSLNWGAWANVGMAATLSEALQARISRMGMGMLEPTKAVSLLGQALARPDAELMVVDIDIRAFERALGGDVPPLFRDLVTRKTTHWRTMTRGAWAEQLAKLDAGRRVVEIDTALRADIAKVMSLASGGDISDDRPLQELGLDSLMAVELRNAIAARVGKPLPATLLFDHPTPRALRQYLLDKVIVIDEKHEPQPSVLPSAPRRSMLDEPIAMIGIGCRFPGGVRDPEGFWHLLENEVDAIREIPKDRWDVEAYYDLDPDAPGKMTTRWGGFLDDIDQFDPAFFGISPREARSVDPQQRLLLETTWEALERAGIPAEQVMDKAVGVYVGICGSEYQQRLLADEMHLDAYSLLGTAPSAIVGRISYWLGLKGPNMAVDTACSSSLVSVHLACHALRSGECSLALAGGVNLVLNPAGTVYFSRLKAMSTTGRCHTFSADADGYVRSEGCAMIVLKRLSDALRDGDPIVGIIRGTAVNQDGRSQGLTAPNGPAQESVIRSALSIAGLQPFDVDYVEAHGTGTPLGDPIEVQALGAALGAGRSPDRPLHIGSVKTNFGHTEGAAGVAGLVKAALSLQHRRIPRSLHFTSPNPMIAWSDLPVQVATQTMPWPSEGKPRIAGVSSFGFSGTNAHVLLEEAPRRDDKPLLETSSYFLPMSAKTPEALAVLVKSWQEWLTTTDAPLQSIAHTASVRRTHHEYRLGVIGTSKQTITKALEAFVSGDKPSEVVAGKTAATAPNVVFVFSGQGSQWVGMGRQLLAEQPAFRNALQTCDVALQRHTGFSILDELGKPEEASRLGETEIAQPTLFAIEVALAKLFQSWGISPRAVIGHSVGEISAAYIAGILDIDQAARVVALRARIMQKATGQGKMLSVKLDENAVASTLEGFEQRVGIAAINDRESVVLSGDVAAMDHIVARLSASNVEHRPLKVNYAFHSPQMDSLRDEFVNVLGTIRPAYGTIPMISTVTGAELSGDDLDATYWGRNIRQTVLFADAIQAAVASGHRLFVEIGPHPVLTLNVESLASAVEGARTIPTMRRQRDELQHVLAALGTLHVHGVNVDWNKLYPDGGRIVELPVYPWQRKRYWIEATTAQRHAMGQMTGHPLLGSLRSVAGAEAVFEAELGPKTVPWLGDHRVWGEILMPGAAIVELVRAAGSTHLHSDICRVEHLVIQTPMRFEENTTRRVQVILSRNDDDDDLGIAVYSQVGQAKPVEPWALHARGVVRSTNDHTRPPLDLHALRARCTSPITAADAYSRFSSLGLDYGPAFQGLTELWRGEHEALSRLMLAESMLQEKAAYGLHPALLDAALQTLAGATDIAGSQIYLPFEFGAFELVGHEDTDVWVHARLEHHTEGADVLAASVDLANARGEVFATLSNIRLKRTSVDVLRQSDEPQLRGERLYRLDWQTSTIENLALPSDGSCLLLGGYAKLVDEFASRLSGTCCNLLTDTLTTWLETPHALESPATVVWSCDTSALGPESSPADVAQHITNDALRLVQRILKNGLPARVFFVTRGAMAILPGEAGSPSLAPLWGFGRTLMQEHPELECRLVDLDPMDDGSPESLWNEFCCKDGESQVAWRGGKRLVVRMARVPVLPEMRSNAFTFSEGTILITGGMGGLGLRAARWLWNTYKVRHLLLVGRSVPDDARLAEVETLRASGARITIAHADISRMEDVHVVLATVPDDAPLRGVIHAAGLLDDGTIAEQNEMRLARVFAPKVGGAWNLHEKTRTIPLDFFVMFSSVASLLGSAGQSNYAAANAFLDALAHTRKAEGLPAQSLNWGAWANVGMAAGLSSALQARISRMGMGMLDPDEAVSLFGQALTRPDAELMVAAFDVRTLERALGDDVPPFFRALISKKISHSRTVARGAWAEQLAKLDAGRRIAEVDTALRAEIAKVMSLASSSEIPEERPLQELGLDSLMAVELRNAIAARVGKPLPATLLFDHPTLRALRRYLFEKVFVIGESRTPVVPSARRRAAQDEPIAIIGMGCRFPGNVKDLDGFWHLLENGVDAIREVPKDRWDIDAYYDPNPDASGKMSTRWGGFLENIDQFDPSFFGISPREARSLDPQQRLLLETTWEALDHAGVPAGTLFDSATGVFVGLMYQDYGMLLGRALENLDGYVGSGNASSVASGRLSYVLGLKGPSMTIDTACSSSLVTVHLACRSLRAGECNMALAGGATVMLTPGSFVEFSRLRGLALDGRCKSFDVSADGVSWSEGCGMVVLKRLSDAQRDGDEILAIIRGSAVNQDGRSNGLTAPNGPAQEAVIRNALDDARLTPFDVDCVEAHGTGTALGDPIEAHALGAVLADGRDPQRPLVIGSVKSNFGHTQAAAGVAGIIKMVLALRHESIPRSLHFHQLNPKITWSNWPIRIASESVPWRTNGKPRIAGVSSFGFSGTNAHVILEEPPRRSDKPFREASTYFLPLSAKNSDALSVLTKSWQEWLSTTDTPLHSIVYTACVRRTHLDYRVGVVGTSKETIVEALRAFVSGDKPIAVVAGRAATTTPKVVFVFSGQGSQWVGMGRQLLAAEPTFRDALESCDKPLKLHTGFSVLDELAKPEESSRLGETEVAQPALFAIEVALARLFQSWGISPHSVIGHSVGEVSAAHIAGILDLDQAARLVALRARIMQKATGTGKMVAVTLDEKSVASTLEDFEQRVGIAAINDRESVVLSGDVEAMDHIVERLSTRGIEHRPLKVNYAFHSPQMDPLRDEFANVLGTIRPAPGTIPMISTVTGMEVSGEDLDATYWGSNIRQTVRFADAIMEASAAGNCLFVELGPHPVLTLNLESLLSAVEGARAIPTLRRQKDELQQVFGALGALHVQGVSVNWNTLYPDGGRVVELPGYPWQRERYWIESAKIAPGGIAADYYDAFTRAVRGGKVDEAEEQELYLTFGPLPEIIPNFSWLQVYSHPEQHAENLELTRLKQLEMRKTLFRHVDFSACKKALDFGCGFGTDVVRLGREHSHLEIDGYTISPEQAASGQRRIRKAGLQNRAHIYHRDSAKDSFPGTYDLVFGFEVAHHILDKHALFTNINEHLDANGTLVLADFIATAASTIEHHESSSVFLTSKEWAEHLSEQRIRVVDCVNVSHEIANYLHDPHFDETLEQLRRAGEDKNILIAFQSYDRLGKLFRRGLAQYVLITARKETDAHVDIETLRNANQQTLDAPIPYASVQPGYRKTDEDLYAVEWQRSDVAPVEKATPNDTWLLFMDEGGTGTALYEQLRAQNHRCVRVTAGTSYQPIEPDFYRLDPTNVLDYQQLLRDAFGNDEPCHGALHLFSLDAAPLEKTTRETLEFDLMRGSISATYLTQALVQHGFRDVPRLILMTRGAHAIHRGDSVAISQAPLFGLGKTIALEQPALKCKQIDLSPIHFDEEISLVLRELRANDREDQVALRAPTERYVARIVKTAFSRNEEPLAEPARARPFQLQIRNPGVFDRLTLYEMSKPVPEPGQVVIDVDTAGMNFRDVLTSLGVIPDDAGGTDTIGPRLGMECAGKVVATGAGVAEFVAGDDVIAVGASAFGSFLVARREHVIKKPAKLSHAHAATLPVAFLTASYALEHVARLRRGERVLIHAGAGGVGLAAIQWAQMIGAEIFATASSEEKRDYLRSLGVTHVFDSRSLVFADEIMRITQGQGIDVVLNSLAGEFIEASMRLLRKYGRFVELGVKDYHANRPLDSKLFLKNISFALVDLRGLVEDKAEFMGELLVDVLAKLDSGRISPLPVQVFPASRAADAFQHMASAKHIGKIALQMKDAHAWIIPQASTSAISIAGDRTYLITGGLGGLGLSLARWLVDHGARNLLLTSRNTPNEMARRAIAAMEESGAHVVTAQADVSNVADMKRIAGLLGQSLPALGGIVHAAGVLDDHTVLELSADNIRNVFAPKALGAWNVHKLALEHAIDFFVTYSSATALFGAPGQGNYAAANAFLDALAHARVGRGLPAMSIQWGAFSDVGMLVAAENRSKRFAGRGVRTLTPEEGLAAFERLLAEPRPVVSYVRFDLRQWVEFFPGLTGLPYLSKIAGAEAVPGPSRHQDRAFLDKFTPARQEDKLAILTQYLTDQMGRVLNLDPARIDKTAPLSGLGVDSLTSLELRNRLETNLGIRLPATVLFTYTTIAALSQHVLTLLNPQAEPDGPPIAAEASPTEPMVDEDLADDDFLSAVDATVAKLS